MVSVALIDVRNKGAGPIPRLMWTKGQIQNAENRARRILRNVGEPATDKWEDGNTTIVIRRLCTEVERSRVLEHYLQ